MSDVTVKTDHTAVFYTQKEDHEDIALMGRIKECSFCKKTIEDPSITSFFYGLDGCICDQCVRIYKAFFEAELDITSSPEQNLPSALPSPDHETEIEQIHADNVITGFGEISVYPIVDAACSVFQIPHSQILSQRDDLVWRARQIIMYLCAKLTNSSIEEICDLLGESRTTVVYAVNRAQEEYKSNDSMRCIVDAICEKIEKNTMGDNFRSDRHTR